MTDRGTQGKQVAVAEVERSAADIAGLAKDIFDNPELAFDEHHAAARVAEILHRRGFDVTTGIGGLPTALEATFGHGELTLAFFAEYDALPGIGHACGHNLIAASSVGAAIGLAAAADSLNVTVKLFGTPAEEGGGGKVTLLDAGCFDGVHAVLMVHPAAHSVLRPPLLGSVSKAIKFVGRESHAASYPENGRNASAAATLTQVSVALLRQHILDGERINGVPLHGWPAANTIPAEATMLFNIRAASAERLQVLEDLLLDCFHGSALATQTQVEISDAAPPYLPMVHDDDLLAIYSRNWIEQGHTCDDVDRGKPVYSSSDLGNVSEHVAAIIPTVALGSGIGTHEPEFTAFCDTDESRAIVVDAAKALAGTGADAASDLGIRNRLLERPLTSVSRYKSTSRPPTG